MELKQLYTWVSLLLSILICKLSECNAKPVYYDLDSYEDDRYDRSSYDNSDNSYALTYGKPLTSDNVHKLNAGYYYVDNGYIAPVPGSTAGSVSGSSQRSLNPYDNDKLANSYKFSPIVRYRKTHTKRKKLFVPNFFG